MLAMFERSSVELLYCSKSSVRGGGANFNLSSMCLGNCTVVSKLDYQKDCQLFNKCIYFIYINIFILISVRSHWFTLIVAQD